MSNDVSPLEKLIAELRRRSVIKVAAIYTAIAWVVLQFADIAFPRLGLPDWTITLVLVLAAVGFPFALLFSWIYERTGDGLKVTAPLSEEEKQRITGGRKLDFVIIAVLSVTVGYLYLERLGHVSIPFTEETSPQQAKLPVDDTPATTPSIAVLPFDNLSSNNENQYFAAGIHEDILTHLSRIEGLKVISRTSMMQYAGNRSKSLVEIAQELDVRHILEGSVRRSGNQVRVTVQLIDATSDAHIWSENYDRKLDNIFEVQSDVAQKVAAQLEVALDQDDLNQVNAKPTESIAAYEVYLRARELMNSPTSENTRQALALFESATALDPQFANAYAGIAYALTGLSLQDADWQSVRIRATQAARKALELDPLSSEGHHAFGMTLRRSDDLDGAEQELKLALSLDPNNSRAYGDLGFVQLFAGNAEGARENALKAIELDPLSPDPLLFLALTIVQPEPLEAIAAVEKAIALNPEYGQAYTFAANILISTGDLQRGYDYHARAIALDPDNLQIKQLASFFLSAIGVHEIVEEWIRDAERTTPMHDAVFNMKVIMIDSQTPLPERTGKFSRDRKALLEAFHKQDTTDSEIARVTGAYYRDNARIALMNEDQAEFERNSTQAIETFEQLLASDVREDGTLRYRFVNSWSLMGYFQVLDLYGERDKASEVIEGILRELDNRPRTFVDSFHQSVAHAYQRDREQALDALEHAYETGFFMVWVVNLYEAFDFMRNDIRFVDIMSRMQKRNDDAAAYIRDRYVRPDSL